MASPVVPGIVPLGTYQPFAFSPNCRPSCYSNAVSLMSQVSMAPAGGFAERFGARSRQWRGGRPLRTLLSDHRGSQVVCMAWPAAGSTCRFVGESARRVDAGWRCWRLLVLGWRSLQCWQHVHTQFAAGVLPLAAECSVPGAMQHSSQSRAGGLRVPVLQLVLAQEAGEGPPGVVTFLHAVLCWAALLWPAALVLSKLRQC